ncbi:MAG: bifunctional helix-turn-helix transcriptional regulator/GNAT family N-acetyltransferase [Pseudomonadota bacterium]
MPTRDMPLVDEIRDASRVLAREWGFMGGRFAGTELSPSAVHALLEIERGGLTARDIGPLLRLEKSSVSRLLRKLIDAGEVAEEADAQDGRVKQLSLTRAGKRRVLAVHAFARAQVNQALGRLTPRQRQGVLQGLRLYADALTAEASSAAVPPVEILRGYQPGLIARITQMHAQFYARHAGFGQRFESVVASGLAEFFNRLDSPRNAVWAARQGAEWIGSVAIDGEDLGGGIAHLRWFIVDDGIRGAGVGRKLLSAALAFADAGGYAQTQLWTFSSLAAARHLYESHGFTCTEERPGLQWGQEVMEQRFVRAFPG